MQTYIVQKGDTLYGISKQFGVSVEDIKAENNLVSDRLAVNMSLLIPTIETTILYVVKRGDTLYSIASKYDTSVSEIIRINNLNSNIINIGQQLRIPINSSGLDYLSYYVKKGDTLYSIANRYDVLVNDLVKINNLSNNSLSIGQILKIPVSVIVPDSEYDTYIVKSGDTLYSIGKRFGISVDELIKINNLSNNSLSVGQVLRVLKNDNDVLEGKSCYGEGYVPQQYETYTVKSGDSLYVIAKRYGVSVDDLIKLNNLSSNNLSIGQVLKIREVN